MGVGGKISLASSFGVRSFITVFLVQPRGFSNSRSLIAGENLVHYHFLGARSGSADSKVPMSKSGSTGGSFFAEAKAAERREERKGLDFAAF